MMPPAEPQDSRRLRWILALAGLGGLMAWTFRYLQAPADLLSTDVAVPILCVTAVFLGFVRRIPERILAGSALILGLCAWLLVSWSRTIIPFPFVDIIRPWGMDKGSYPIIRPMLGLLVLLFAWPATMGRGGKQRATRIVGMLGCVVLLGFWSVPRWFEMDLVTPDGRIPDLPQWVAQPGEVGAGETPVVVDGTLQHLHWTQYAYRSVPALATRYLIVREHALASITWGMQWERTELDSRRAAAGAISARDGEDSIGSDGAAGFQTVVRKVLWTLQKAATEVHICLQVASLPVWLLLLGLFARGTRLRRRIVPWLDGLILVQTLGVFAINGILAAAVLAFSLPEGSSKTVGVGLRSLGMVVVCIGLREAGKVLARGPTLGLGRTK